MSVSGTRFARVRLGLVAAVSWVMLVGAPALGQSPAAPGEKPTLLLLPVVVHSSESPEYLREGLSDMLASRFIQAGDFAVMRVDDPRKATTRIPDALEVAAEEGADFVLFGSFTRFGAGASLDMQAAATDEGEEGQTLREIFVHSGSIGEVIPDLTDLVGKVTRFAIPAYATGTGEPVPDAAPGAVAAAPSGSELAELRRRVAALEQALRGLQSGPAPAP